jgi:general secretion pathway protein M
MSLRARYDKLEPREQRLLLILGSVLLALVVLGIPVGIWTVVSGRRSQNDDLRNVIESIYEKRAEIAEKKAKQDALRARYAKTAPPLAGFLAEAATSQGITAAESQDRPEAPHGKRFSERMTVVKIHKVGLLPLAKMLERIEQSGYPVVISKISIKPRSGESDSYSVELGVSAFDRKGEPGAAKGASSASAPPKAPPAASADEEEDEP